MTEFCLSGLFWVWHGEQSFSVEFWDFLILSGCEQWIHCDQPALSLHQVSSDLRWNTWTELNPHFEWSAHPGCTAYSMQTTCACVCLRSRFTKFTKRLIIVVSCCSLEFVSRIVVWGFSTGSFWQCRHISDLKTDQSCHQRGEMSPCVRVYECVSLCKLQSAAKPLQLRHLRLSSLVPSGTR